MAGREIPERIIPFNKPFVPDESRAHVLSALSSGHLSGDGPMTRQVVSAMGRVMPGHVLLTPSCTHALELACRLLDLGPGDEVILPSFNFPSAATAVSLTGATPVFVDVDPETLNLTVTAVLEALTDRTRAVIVLHYAGRMAPVLELQGIATDFGFKIIEDAAHAFGVETDLGTIGSHATFSTFSFHETKNFQCGEGGALVINDAEFIDRAEILREKGTNRQRYFRGQVDKYSWIDHGSSWLLADPLAGLLLGQIDKFEFIQESRRTVIESYREQLHDWSVDSGFHLMPAPTGQRDAAHMFYMIAPDLKSRQSLLSHLKIHGVTAAFHYQPLDQSAAGLRFGRTKGCPVSEHLGDHLLRLPVFAEMSTEDLSHVVESVRTLASS